MIWLIVLIVGVALGLKEKLQFVLHVGSIGARYPYEKRGDWVKYPGDVTHVGMRQLYILGRELRKKYIDQGKLLDSQYSPFQLKVRAPVQNKTSAGVSAYAFLRGFYMPGTGYTLDKEQIANAIPPANGTNFTMYQKELKDAALPHYFSSIPVIMHGGGPDFTLAPQFDCSNLNNVIQNYVKGNKTLQERIKKLERKYKTGVYKELSEAFKIPVDSMETALNLEDYVKTAYHHGKDIGVVLSDDAREQLREMSSLVNYEIFYGDVRVAKTMSQGVLNEAKKEIEKSFSSSDSRSRRRMLTFMLFSQNIRGFLRLLEHTPEVNIPFASSLQFEFYQEDPDILPEVRVRVLFNGKLLSWGESKHSISFEKFMSWIDEQLNEDFSSLCIGLEKSSDSGTPWIAIWIVLGGALLVIAIVGIIMIINRRRHGEKGEMHSLPDNELTVQSKYLII